MNPDYSFRKSYFDWNKFYKYDLKFTVRAIPTFLKPLNAKIKVELIKIKKIFRKQKRC